MGPVHESSMLPSFPTAAKPVGTPGTALAVGVAEAVDSLPAPTALTARSWKVWAVPFVRPRTSW